MKKDDKEGEEESDEEGEGEFEEERERKREKVKVPPLPIRPSAPALTRLAEIIEEEEEEEELRRKDKGKLPVGGMRKSVSENFANKYAQTNHKKGGFGGFLKKIELKKKS